MKAKSVYRCTECGAESLRWAGRCEGCGEWNTLVEEAVAAKAPAGKGAGAARRKAGAASFGDGGSVRETPRLRDVRGEESHRLRTGLGEFDFVLGGGVVPGAMVLIGGEPGIGKSTILLQVAALLEGAGHRTLYVSGEESPLQVKLRADRLAVDAGGVPLLGETNLETILATAAEAAPAVLVVDSIQTVFTADLEGAPGNVGQVRECAARLMRFAKETGTAVLVVGHVTKGGGIAGPKTLEHIVDTVLYFEGEGTGDHRVLRATKNRFGSVDELGVFRVTPQGLVAVDNPSALFLGDRESARTSGSAVTCLLEGTRPMLLEVQAKRIGRVVLEQVQVPLGNQAVLPIARLPVSNLDASLQHGVGHALRLQHFQRGRMKGAGPQVQRGARLTLEHQNRHLTAGELQRAQQSDRACADHDDGQSGCGLCVHGGLLSGSAFSAG